MPSAIGINRNACALFRSQYLLECRRYHEKALKELSGSIEVFYEMAKECTSLSCATFCKDGASRFCFRLPTSIACRGFGVTFLGNCCAKHTPHLLHRNATCCTETVPTIQKRGAPQLFARMT